MKRASAILLAMLVLLGGARLAPCFDDLWFDEIWTLANVTNLDSVSGILAIRHDNNHLLNSLVLYMLGADVPDWSYRLPSWIAGVLSVALAWRFGRRQWRSSGGGEGGETAAGIAAAVLVGGSYLLIHHGSEARGYSMAICFGLAAWTAALEGDGGADSRWAVPYWLASILAMLAHPTALYGLAASTVWTVVRGWRASEKSVKRAAVSALWWNLLPLLAAVALYRGFLSGLTIGGGPEHPLPSVLGWTAAYALGLPVGWGTTLALPLAAVAGVTAAVLMARRGGDLWMFYASGVVAAPAVVLAWTRPEKLYERYFIVGATMLLLLLSWLAAWAWTRAGRWRIGAAVLAGLFVVGNSVHLARLLSDGRGGYRRTLAHVAENSPDGIATIGSDHDYRNGLLVQWHGRRSGLAERIRYLPQNGYPPSGPDWILMQSQDTAAEAPPGIQDPLGNRYVLAHVERFAGMSGWQWFLYRNAGRQ